MWGSPKKSYGQRRTGIAWSFCRQTEAYPDARAAHHYWAGTHRTVWSFWPKICNYSSSVSNWLFWAVVTTYGASMVKDILASLCPGRLFQVEILVCGTLFGCVKTHQCPWTYVKSCFGGCSQKTVRQIVRTGWNPLSLSNVLCRNNGSAKIFL